MNEVLWDVMVYVLPAIGLVGLIAVPISAWRASRRVGSPAREEGGRAPFWMLAAMPLLSLVGASAIDFVVGRIQGLRAGQPVEGISDAVWELPLMALLLGVPLFVFLFWLVMLRRWVAARRFAVVSVSGALSLALLTVCFSWLLEGSRGPDGAWSMFALPRSAVGYVGLGLLIGWGMTELPGWRRKGQGTPAPPRVAKDAP